MNKRHSATAAALLTFALAAPLSVAAAPVSRDALAAVDLNRTAIVADVVASFAADVTAAHPGAAAQHLEALRSRVGALRADQLLAASLASSYSTLQAILAEADRAALRPVAKALGDANADLTYTPLAPCRLIDTRGFGAPIQGGAFAPNERRGYDPAGQCAVPAAGVASLMISFTTQNLTPASGGYLAIVAPAAPIAASVDVFNLNSEWSASNTVVATGTAGQFDVFVSTANAHVVVDVLGYFKAPSGVPAGDVTGVTAGTGLVGGGTSGGVTLGIATPYRLPQGCVANQLPKWNGTTWACAADNDTDTNTIYTAGSGITLAGAEFSLPATQALPTVPCQAEEQPRWNGTAWACASDGLRQDGNAFGAVARIGTTDLQAVEIVGNGTRMLRLEPGSNATVRVVGGSPANTAPVMGGTIAGGGALGLPNTVTGDFGTVSGGRGHVAGLSAAIGGGTANTAAESASVGGGTQNLAEGVLSAIAGGQLNTAGDNFAFVGGGSSNWAEGLAAAVGGGLSNLALGQSAFVGGGTGNSAVGDWSTVAGGISNGASGLRATVPGGEVNEATGSTSFAAGRRAKAVSHGCFVWGDSTNADVACTGTNQFVARAVGGVTFYTNAGLTSGVNLPAGSGAWGALSDRAAKKDLAPVDARSVLERVAAMPLYTWRYIGEVSGALHLGPVAQDFRAAFGLGDGDRTISTVDADGVALAAIQGLHAQLAEKSARIDALEAALREVRERLERLPH